MSKSADKEADTMVKRFVLSQLAEGKVTIWTEGDNDIRSGRTSKKVKKILNKHQIPFTEVDITKLPWEECTAQGLHMHTGFETFPNIYLGTEHMGGLDDLQC